MFTRHASFGPLAIAFCLAGAAAGAGGCLVIPIPHPSTRYADSRTRPDEQILKLFSPGSTRRDEMILALGEPEYALQGGSCIVWHWRTAELTVVILVGSMAPGGGGVGGADVPSTHYLVARFDDAGVLRDVERINSERFDPARPTTRPRAAGENRVRS